MRRTLLSVGMKIFVEFYDLFKVGHREETIRQLMRNGDVETGAKTRCSKAKHIFDNNLQRDALTLVISSRRIDEETKAKARVLLVRELRS